MAAVAAVDDRDGVQWQRWQWRSTAFDGVSNGLRQENERVAQGEATQQPASTMIGAALMISIRKKYFQTLFFSVKTCRYGVSYEISSRKISKKVIFWRSMCVFSCFFLFCWEKCVFGWVSCCFHCCLATCVGTHHAYIFLYSLLYQMK
jgi:hypothetical protein